jgi:uncharacterized protein YjbI with pentapeptide repeats
MKSLLQVVKEQLPQDISSSTNVFLMAIQNETDLNRLIENKYSFTEEIIGAKSAEALTKPYNNLDFFAALITDPENVINESIDEVRLKGGEIIAVFSLSRIIREFGQQLNLRNANLRGTQLQSADLPGAFLENCNLQGANLNNANLKEANLTGANLEGCNLTEANLFAADLTNTDLRRANLTQAELRKTTMKGTSLRGAELWSASMWGVDIEHSFHSGVDLSRADTRGS